jgi:hypothetical protein
LQADGAELRVRGGLKFFLIFVILYGMETLMNVLRKIVVNRSMKDTRLTGKIF